MFKFVLEVIMKRLFTMIFLCALTMPLFAFQLDMRNSNQLLLTLNASETKKIHLKNFQLQENQVSWIYYCEILPLVPNVVLTNIKKNYSTPALNTINIVSPSRFDFTVSKDENGWQTLDFHVTNNDTFAKDVSITCWKNGNLNPQIQDHRYKVHNPLAAAAPLNHAVFIPNREDFELLKIKVASLQESDLDPLVITELQREILEMKKQLPKNAEQQQLELTELEGLLSVFQNLNIDSPHEHKSTHDVRTPTKEKEKEKENKQIQMFDWRQFPMLLNANGRPFLEPVVIVSHGPLIMSGRTMEKNDASILIANGYPNLIYYPNLALKEVIGILSKTNALKDSEEKILDIITDPFSLDTLDKPYIFDEGQSASKTSIDILAKGTKRLHNMITRKEVQINTLVLNINLQEFIETYLDSIAKIKE